MPTYYVYLMASRSRVLYSGVTNDLQRRVQQHKTGLPSGFTSWYNLTRLVHFEQFNDIRKAIAREKRIKAWSRAKRITLIETTNPHWMDLAKDWHPQTGSPHPHRSSL